MQLRDVVGFLFDFGVDVLGTVLDQVTGVIVAQLGDATTEAPNSKDAEWWQHAGFASRPAPPVTGGAACQAVIFRRPDRDVVIATRDTRGTSILGNLAAGEACLYAPGAQGRLNLKADGSARAQTTDDNTPTGKTVMAGIGSFYQTAQGPAKGGEWRVYAPWGGQWMDPTGWHLRMWEPGPPSPSGAPATGTYIDFGPNPFPALPGLTPLSAGIISVDSLTLDAASLTIGRDNGLSDSLLQSHLTSVQLQLITTALASLATAVGAFTGSGTFPGLPAVQTQIMTAATAMANLPTTSATKATTAT